MKTLHGMCTAVLCGAVFAGCVTSRTPDCFGYRPDLGTGKEKKSIAYSFRRSGNVSIEKAFDPASATPATCGAWVGSQDETSAIRQFYTTFGPASTAITPTIDRNGGNCDIMLDIHQQNAWNPLCVFPVALCAFTLTCCPCWGDDVFHLNVSARSKSGLSREYTISRKVTTTTWLPFILATPFSDPPLISRDKITLENWKEIRCRLESDGFFDASGTEKGQATPATQDAIAPKMASPAMPPQTDGRTSTQVAVEMLLTLKDLHAKGLITDEEYNTKKVKIIKEQF